MFPEWLDGRGSVFRIVGIPDHKNSPSDQRIGKLLQEFLRPALPQDMASLLLCTAAYVCGDSVHASIGGRHYF